MTATPITSTSCAPPTRRCTAPSMADATGSSWPSRRLWRHKKPGPRPGSSGPGFWVSVQSAVLADTGDQPGLVVAIDTFHAPAFAEGLALVEARGLGQAAEGQGGDGLVGQLVDAIELHLEVVDVGGLEAVTQAGALFLEEAEQLRGDELADLVHFGCVPVLLQGQEVGAAGLEEALLVEPGRCIEGDCGGGRRSTAEDRRLLLRHFPLHGAGHGRAALLLAPGAEQLED